MTMTNTHKTINMLLKDKELSFLTTLKDTVLHKTAPKQVSYRSHGEVRSYMTKGVTEDFLKIWMLPSGKESVAISFDFEKDIVSFSTETKVPVDADHNFAASKDEDYEKAKNKRVGSFKTEEFKEKLKEFLKMIRKDNSQANINSLLAFFNVKGV